MYINYNIQQNKSTVNNTSKKGSCYLIKPNNNHYYKHNPIYFKARSVSSDIKTHIHPLTSHKITPNILPPKVLSKYPCLNPMYKNNYKISKSFLQSLDSDEENEKELVNNREVTNSEEELFNYENRNNIKEKSSKILNDCNKYNIVLLRGDVVNIDKKTLVFDKFDYKTCRHVFKELTSLKVYDYNLNTREYKIIIPSKLKHDIENPPSLKKISYTENDIYSPKDRKPILEISNITSPMLYNSYYYTNSSIEYKSDSIVKEYLSDMNDYKFDSENFEVPCVVNNNDQSYNGIYFIDPSYKNVNGRPVYSNNAKGSLKRFIFRYPVKFSESGFVWVLQPISPLIQEWCAHAYGYGDDLPWNADWGDTQVIKSSEYRQCKLQSPDVSTYTCQDYKDTIQKTKDDCTLNINTVEVHSKNINVDNKETTEIESTKIETKEMVVEDTSEKISDNTESEISKIDESGIENQSETIKTSDIEEESSSENEYSVTNMCIIS